MTGTAGKFNAGVSVNLGNPGELQRLVKSFRLARR